MKPATRDYRLLTYKEAMAKLGITSRTTFQNILGRGILQSATVKIPGMAPKIREDVLDRMIEDNTLQTAV